MEKGKICFVTPYHMNPPAPRVLKEMEVLKEENYYVNILFPPKNLGVHKRNLYLRKEFSKVINLYDKFIIYDLLTLIYLSPIIKNSKNKIIYEVLDSFPHYYSYKILKNYFPILESSSIYLLDKIEMFFLKNFTNYVLVNSKALFERLSKYTKNIGLLFYTSPFEHKEFNNNPDLPPAFIYIGTFSIEKGGNKILKLANKYPNIKFFIIGNSFISSKMPKNLILYPRLETDKLFNILKTISQNFFLFGLSFIESKNKSYAIQEANKDIDYLALGIPIIGNKRKPTYEKIKKGAGLLVDEDLNNKIFNKELKRNLSLMAKKLYNQHFSYKNFRKVLLNAVKQ